MNKFYYIDNRLYGDWGLGIVGDGSGLVALLDLHHAVAQ